VLAQVDVTVRVKELADRVALVLIEVSLEDVPCSQEQSRKTVQLVVQELPMVHVTVIKLDFAVASLVVAPRSCERSVVDPGHRSLAIALPSLEVAFVGCVFCYSIRANERILVVHGSVTARMAVFK